MIKCYKPSTDYYQRCKVLSGYLIMYTQLCRKYPENTRSQCNLTQLYISVLMRDSYCVCRLQIYQLHAEYCYKVLRWNMYMYYGHHGTNQSVLIVEVSLYDKAPLGTITAHVHNYFNCSDITIHRFHCIHNYW